MALSNEQKMDILLQEIDNLKILLIKIDEDRESLDALTQQKQKINDALSVTPIKDKFPIHRLLSCKLLTKTEIPLLVLENLIESGFDVNARFSLPEDEYEDDKDEYDVDHVQLEDISIGSACLNLAIQNDHYSAVQCLLQHGANCETGSIKKTYFNRSEGYIITPIAELAMKANAPLALFDLLATPESLRNNGDNRHLPLHLALRNGHTESAQHLIKLGADVNLKDYSDNLPLHLYVRNINLSINEYNDELCLLILPSGSLTILQFVKILVPQYVDREDRQMWQNKMIHRLFQYMDAADHLHIDIKCPFKNIFEMMINSQLRIQRFSRSIEYIYWWSLLLVNLGWAIGSTPEATVPLLPDSASVDDVQFAHKIDDIWNKYRDTRAVLSLQNMCIQQVRRCMRDFSDDSFMSLHVPSILWRLLMYEHIADIVCECR